ncbi:MAG: hypothetical protein L0209_10230, partial [candidate division Zixibacteria bacterium]|nr:hypothetical protein [candidate division Zixibacteria bacterium]
DQRLDFRQGKSAVGGVGSLWKSRLEAENYCQKEYESPNHSGRIAGWGYGVNCGLIDYGLGGHIFQE